MNKSKGLTRITTYSLLFVMVLSGLSWAGPIQMRQNFNQPIGPVYRGPILSPSTLKPNFQSDVLKYNNTLQNTPPLQSKYILNNQNIATHPSVTWGTIPTDSVDYANTQAQLGSLTNILPLEINDEESVKKLQEMLKGLGFYKYEIDGNPDTYLSDAIWEYNRNIQTILNELGLYNDSIDGYPGLLTIAALKEFQQTRGLSVTGKVDGDTWKALKERREWSPLHDGAIGTAPSSTPIPSPELPTGAAGVFPDGDSSGGHPVSNSGGSDSGGENTTALIIMILALISIGILIYMVIRRRKKYQI